MNTQHTKCMDAARVLRDEIIAENAYVENFLFLNKFSPQELKKRTN